MQKEQGFKALPLRVSSASTANHYVYVKQHSIRNFDETKPPDRTLFVLNVPPYATEDSLKHSFSPAGKVEAVILQNNNESPNDGFKRAYVVFDKRESLLKALKLESLNPLSSDSAPLKAGIEKWTEEYNASICSPKDLQNKINRFMASYDKRENQKKTNKTETTDDEGWTLVTKRGRNPGVARKESVGEKLNEKLKKGSKKKELKNFYTFQIRESKMKNIVELRKNFEEAKKKVSLMKQARKFRPY
ncbi:hypothetical protein NQ318_002784 [Aromia moschata]|uniref:RRM domain-containing protein n=1 Tax=Aromia moschata TaxID=1265417 RepID=A0AAV8XUM0_9CUCU|nr:hypothetical protein NQ318_002784 [Aromia moschata]